MKNLRPLVASLALLVVAAIACAQTKMVVFIDNKPGGTATISEGKTKSGNIESKLTMNIEYSGVKASFSILAEGTKEGMPIRAVITTDGSQLTCTYSRTQVSVVGTLNGEKIKRTIAVERNQSLVDASEPWFISVMPKLNRSVEYWTLNDDYTALVKEKVTYLGRKSIKVAGKKIEAHVIQNEEGEKSYLDEKGMPYIIEINEGGMEIRLERAKI